MSKEIGRAKVTGYGEFPFDMLRYDGCYPASENDTGTMLASVAGPRTVTVAQLHEGRSPCWTPLRWASFGWTLEVQP